MNVGDAVVAYAIEKFGLKVKPPDLKADADDLELARTLDKVKDKWNPQAKNRIVAPSLPQEKYNPTRT